MEKLTVPGNPRLMELIRQAAERGSLGQAFLLSGPGDKTAAARYLAAALECTGESPPCGACRGCRKVMAGIHPDVVTVADPEHKNISVEVLRAVRADAYVLPNEGRRKVYIFPDSALLDARSQNVLLKVLEEGPAHAAFLFCADNSAVLLQTVRSRCVEWKMQEEDPSAAGRDDRAGRLASLICSRDRLGLAVFFTRLEVEKAKREDLQQLLEDTRQLLAERLLAAEGCGGTPCPLDAARLNAAAELLDRHLRQLRYNVNVGHAAGALSVGLGRILERDGRRA